MRLDEIHSELIPRSPMIKADKLAKEFVELATSEFGKGQADFDPEGSAKQIAKKFYQMLVQHIEDHSKYQRMKKL